MPDGMNFTVELEKLNPVISSRFFTLDLLLSTTDETEESGNVDVNDLSALHVCWGPIIGHTIFSVVEQTIVTFSVTFEHAWEFVKFENEINSNIFPRTFIFICYSAILYSIETNDQTDLTPTYSAEFI